jgi:hypothetical protein
VQRDANGAFRSVQQSVRPSMDAPANGRFEIPNVAPGSYELFASLPDATGWGPSAAPGTAQQPVGFGRTMFEARGNVTDVQVNVHPGVDLKGRVTLDGKPAAPAGLQIYVQPDSGAMMVLPYNFISRFQPAIGADGTFTFPALPEAEYAIRVGMNSPSTSALAEILLDGNSVKSAVRIGAKSPGLVEIRLTNGGGPALSSVAPPPRGAAAAAANTGTAAPAARGPRANAPATAPTARGGPSAAPPTQPVVLAPSGRPAVLQSRLESLPSGAAGTARDCGHAGKEAPQAVVQCVEQAIARKETFIASFPQASVDSQVVLGVASAGPGAVTPLLFDSVDTRVSTMRDCAQPRFAVSGQFVHLACN